MTPNIVWSTYTMSHYFVSAAATNNPFLQDAVYGATGAAQGAEQGAEQGQYYGRGYTQAQSGYSASGLGY